MGGAARLSNLNLPSSSLFLHHILLLSIPFRTWARQALQFTVPLTNERVFPWFLSIDSENK